MRIVGGSLGGRRFPGPPGGLTRPTSERVREALASALVSRGAFDDANVLDLYAGTGALAFEAISRGAREATLVEADARVVRALTQSAQSLGIRDRVRILRTKVGSRLPSQVRKRGPFDLVFIDPPYANINAAMTTLSTAKATLSPGALVVVEFAKDNPPESLPLPVVARYEYGVAALAFLENR